MSNRVSTPFPIFNDTDGSPLDAGSIFIGQAGKNPIASPMAIFYDSTLTTPAEQPVKTRNGYIVRNGAVRELYSKEPIVSILVKNKQGVDVWASAKVNLNPGLTTDALFDTESGLSQEAINKTILNKNQNLEDLENKDEARNNLNVYSKEEVNEKAPQATEEVAGISKITTEELVKAGVDDETFVTPKKLRMALSADDETPIFACRAWVCFNGSNGEIKASGNIKTVVRNSVGEYTITFEKDMPHENYTWLASGQSTGPLGNFYIYRTNSGQKSKSVIQIRTTNANNALWDPLEICLSIFC